MELCVPFTQILQYFVMLQFWNFKTSLNMFVESYQITVFRTLKQEFLSEVLEIQGSQLPVSDSLKFETFLAYFVMYAF